MNIGHENFTPWKTGNRFNGRLQLIDASVNEDLMSIRFLCPESRELMVISSDSCLGMMYTSESANFMEFGDLPIAECRMWIAESSDWIRRLRKVGGDVFDDVSLRHYLFVFTEASVEALCLTVPEVREVSDDV